MKNLNKGKTILRSKSPYFLEKCFIYDGKDGGGWYKLKYPFEKNYYITPNIDNFKKSNLLMLLITSIFLPIKWKIKGV